MNNLIAYHRVVAALAPFGLTAEAVPETILAAAVASIANTITTRNEDFIKGVVSMTVRAVLMSEQAEQS